MLYACIFACHSFPSAPSYLEHCVFDPLAISPMARLLMRRRAEREAAEKDSSVALPAPEDPPPIAEDPTPIAEESAPTKLVYIGTAAQMKEQQFLMQLHRTVLFSHFRQPQLLSVPMKGLENFFF